MAYSANGYNYPDKKLSRVKYDLIVYDPTPIKSTDVLGVDIEEDYIITGEEDIIL